MRTLFAYYSLEGNCRALGACMADAVGGVVDEIRPVVQSIPEKGFLRLLKGGKESFMKETPELLPAAENPREYELVVVGGPVWAWNMSPPVRTFLMQNHWKGVSVALFCMHRGGRGFTLSAMRGLVEEAGGSVVAAADFKDLRWGDGEKTKRAASEWIRGTVERIAATREGEGAKK